jgi:hypothetical protein
MEQVADWEVGTGRSDQESTWTKSKKMVVCLPDGKTRTIGISQVRFIKNNFSNVTYIFF